MKNLLVAVTMLLSLTLLGCSGGDKHKLEGTWRLVSRTQTVADTVAVHPRGEYLAMMMMFRNQIASFSRYSEKGDTSYGYAEGTYDIVGNDLTARYEYHVDPTLVGKDITWDVNVRGDSLAMKGPRKVGEKQDTIWQVDEVWTRVK